MNSHHVTINSSNTEKELNQKDIFQEIGSDILSTEIFPTRKQKTYPNYRFIIFLNVIAIIIALIGGFFVYNIFKERKIRLIEGQGAVKTLELVILRQINQQRENELKSKEQELLALKEQLKRSEEKLVDIRSNIIKKAHEELLARKAELIKLIKKEIEGKTLQEQAKIKKRYQEKIKILEEQIKALINQRIEEAEHDFAQEQEELRLKTEQLSSELEVAQLNVQKAKQNINQIAEVNPTIIESIIPNQSRDKITRLFLEIQQDVNNNEFSKIEQKIAAIKQEYTQINDPKNLMTRQVDFFVIDIVNEYISNTIALSNLYNQLNNTINEANNLTNNFVSQTSLNQQQKEINQMNEKIKQLELSNETLLEFKMTILDTSKKTPDFYEYLIQQIELLVKEFNKTGNDQALKRRINLIKEKEPVIIALLESYSNYQVSIHTKDSTKIFEKAEKLFKQQKYKNAIDVYQSILRLYPNSKYTETVLEHLYTSIVRASQDNKVVLTESGPLTELQLKQIELEQSQNPKIKEILYLQNPQGYVIEILEDTIAIMLIPNSMLKLKDRITVFRVNQKNLLQFSPIYNSQIQEIQGNIAFIPKNVEQVKIGDLIYLTKNI